MSPLHHRSAASLAIALAAVLAGPVTVSADAAVPPTPSASPTPSSTPTISAAEAQRALTQQQAALTQERRRLTAATATAAALLQDYQRAQRAADAASRRVREEAGRLRSAEQRTSVAKVQLQGYVGSLYRTGMIDSSLNMLATVVHAKNPQQLFGGLGLAERVGAHRSDAFAAFTDAQQAQDAAAARSRVAAQAQRLATAQAAAARNAANRMVADFQARVALRRQAVGFTRSALADAEHREQMLARAEAIARIRSRPPAAAILAALASRPSATCKGKSTVGYLNGRIPAETLCPLWATYGHMLRADAAAAFNDLSRDYAITFGKPICVTDSYRSYAEQQAVKENKPGLAATPGRSNHGWGVATDLCDDIQRFGTPTHQWMQDNSMRFGWFHPDWAEPTGSLPEPWHWEFAG